MHKNELIVINKPYKIGIKLHKETYSKLWLYNKEK